jgi:hypothetical protein
MCKCQHVQPTVLLETWWYYPSNAILSYATRKKSHGTKLGRCGMTVILFLVRNLGTDSTVNRCKSQIMQQFDKVQILSKWSELTQVSKFIDSACCFWWHAPLQDAHCHLFCLLIHVSSVQYLSERSHCFWSWKTVSTVSSPKATLKIFKVCVHLTQFKVKLDVDKP